MAAYGLFRLSGSVELVGVLDLPLRHLDAERGAVVGFGVLQLVPSIAPARALS